MAANPTAVTLFPLSYSRHGSGFGPYRIDLAAYRLGARAWLRGADLCGRVPVTRAGLPLPFTYPPIAAVELAPLALMTMTAAGTALTVDSLALAAVVLRVGPAPPGRARRGVALADAAGFKARPWHKMTVLHTSYKSCRRDCSRCRSAGQRACARTCTNHGK